MSLDYLEDACECLDNYDYPWVVLVMPSPEMVSSRWKVAEINAELTISNLYDLIDQIKEEYDIL